MTLLSRCVWTMTCWLSLAVAVSAATHADGEGSGIRSCPEVKMMFVLFCRADITHEACMAGWNGRQHTRLVKRIPNVVKHVRNATIQLPFAGAADGIGELWFPTAADMDAALSSPEFNAALVDGQRYFDLGRTYAIVVDEIPVIGRKNECSSRER